jgi:hypothetical protein
MESRRTNAEQEIERLLTKLFAGVQVFQAGGQEITEGNELSDRITKAAKASVVRLYRDFDVADHDAWGKVLSEAQKGNPEALKAVGHATEADKHPVCMKVMAYIGPGKKGAEIRDNFSSPPFGWPRDAIDGALYTLLATGHVRATDTTGKQLDGKSLDRNKLTQASFRLESVTISPVQKIKIRGVFNSLQVPVQPNEELARVPALLAKLRLLAAAAGGLAPQPELPKTAAIDAVDALGGNGMLLELYNRADELTALAKEWEATQKAIANRLPAWGLLKDLLAHAKDLGPCSGFKAELEAIEAQRSLLDNPDPVRPLLDNVTEVVRQALITKLTAYSNEYEAQTKVLEADANWQKLTPEQRTKLIADHHIEAPKAVSLATADALLDALDDCNLQRWIERAQALSSRYASVQLDAAKLLKPNVVQVKLPRRTLNDQSEVKAWLAEVEATLLEQINKGPIAL